MKAKTLLNCRFQPVTAVAGLMGVALLAVSAVAHATIFNLGTISPTPAIEFVVHAAPDEPPPFVINDYFYFTVPGSNTSSNSVNNPLTIVFETFSLPIFDIANLRMSLFNADNNQLMVGPVTGEYTAVLGGNYFWEVQGTTTGLSGGAYTFLISAQEPTMDTPVPEPGSSFLLSGGLVLLGIGARRKRGRAGIRAVARSACRG